MKDRRVLLAAVFVLVCAAVASAGCRPGTTENAAPRTTGSALPDFKAGDRVAATWDDGNFYLAEVTLVSVDGVTVRYTDSGTERSMAAGDLRPIVVKDWAVGDKVLAVWALGRFYPGTVTASDGSDFTIAWDDGSTPSDVTADKIISAE